MICVCTITKLKKLTGLKQIVKFLTRGKNTLDQIFTNIPTTKPVRIFPLIGKSDHSCVFCSHQDHVVHYVKRSVRLMSKSRIARFNSILCDIDWLKYVSSFNNIEEAFLNFQSALKSVFDYCFPSRIVRVCPTDQPWVKPSLKILINDQDRAFYNGYSCKYQRLRQSVIDHIRELKSKYLSCFFVWRCT